MNIQRLLVISDTHGHVRGMEAILNWAQDSSQSGGINAAVFLGDGVPDVRRGADASGFSCDWRIIRGNSDLEASLPLSDIFEFGGHRFFLCHGHRYDLYNGFQTLTVVARSSGADAALFGHTHIPYCERDGNVLLVNPGSVGRPRSRIGATFAVIECEPEKPLRVEFWGIDDAGNIRKL